MSPVRRRRLQAPASGLWPPFSPECEGVDAAMNEARRVPFAGVGASAQLSFLQGRRWQILLVMGRSRPKLTNGWTKTPC